MSFFDCGLVNFIKLLIIVGLISMLYMIVMQKIKEQNHKITSLLSLVTTMAHEITVLKGPTLLEKNEISDDSDTESSDTESDTDDESIDLEEIDLVKGDKITMLESDITELEFEEPVESIESVLESVLESVIDSEIESISEPVSNESIKKMTIKQLQDLVVSKNLKSKTDAVKLKKAELLNLLI
jgi:hypothetical protein